MAVSTEMPRSFRFYVTHVDGEGHFLKISGQLDQQASLMIESLFVTSRENLEKGIGAASPGSIHEGIICAAKYKDGTYYRAKVINMTNIANGLVGVHFIDFGNKDIISLSTIRFLDNYDPIFLQLRGQATDYYLSRVINPSGRWEEPVLMKLQSLLCYQEYQVTLDVHTQSLPLISIQFKGNDLSTHIVSIRFGMAIPLAKQEVLLLQVSDSQHAPNWQSNYVKDVPAFSEHIPFLLNQNFPANPASAMRLQQSVALPFNGNIPATPSLISNRLQSQKASRTAVNIKAPIRQPQHASGAGLVLSTPPPTTTAPFTVVKPTSPKKSTTYKSKLLEMNAQYRVFVSYAEEGPELFAVQLVSESEKLQAMMDDINRRPHSSLAEPPMIGTVCLGRMSGDRIICRAIVMNLSGSQCKLFFVDFGDTEMVSYYDIFDIPEEFVKPNVFAMRFCLSGVKKLEKGPHLNEAFKSLASGKVLTLKVVAPEGPPLIQYGELYLDNKNILELLMANMKDKLQFKWPGMLALGAKHSALVSYVDSCIKFYIQPSEKIEELNAVMVAVKAHCEGSAAPGAGSLAAGVACCARFPEDGNWYRARVQDVVGDRTTVVYVDYGNEQEVDAADLRTITPHLMQLPAVAIKCALKGFENKPVESKTSNQLEMLALEKTLVVHAVGVLSGDTMLVTLVDDSVAPPLDIARKMNQLSQPRGSHELKAATPAPGRKEAGESFSSPEGSAGACSEDGRRRSFRRERSFKDDQRPFQASSPEGARTGLRRERSWKEGRGPRPPAAAGDPSQRGGSFRARGDRTTATGDRFAGRADTRPDRTDSRPDRTDARLERTDTRPDRNDRRGGSKPWENGSTPAPVSAAPAAAAGEDDWEEEAPAHNNNNYQQQTRTHNRDNNRDRRKPREGQAPRSEACGGKGPGWRKEAGTGRRMAGAGGGEPPPRSSVQDRLRRDTRSNQQEGEEKRNDDWGNRSGAGRAERRGDTRGDRRDTWAERGPRRDYNKDRDGRERNDFSNRDTHRERSDFGNRQRGGARGSYTSRPRADRSFDDNKSDKSFRSQGSGGGGGKPRGKFAPAQPREISEPVPLDTPFKRPHVELGAQQEVSVTWIISPASFYTQILSLQAAFLEMMHGIPAMYAGVRSYDGPVAVGASVLARYPADGVLYRATVLAAQPFNRLIVQYVDFGNKQVVEARDIWQLDRRLIELPAMAVQCALAGVAPAAGEWRADEQIDLCFNAPRYQCVFQEPAEDCYCVFLWHDGVSVADTLISKQLALPAEDQHSAVTLKDEPIDMTIIVGQQLICRVTHVAGYEQFSLHLDLEKASRVEETIAAYDISKLTPPSPELIVEGTHCTVRHEGRIYRAVLRDTGDKERVTALLADYGNEITTHVDNVMILPSELSVYYYQALQCALHNYSAESSQPLLSVDQLREKLTGNKFIVYVNDVDGITLLCTLYELESGAKLGVFTPDEGAPEAVPPLCPRAVLNYSCGRAYLAHAAALHALYLQRSADSEPLAALLEQLYAFYEEGSPEPLTTFEEKTLGVAKSADGNWYRASVLSAQDDQVTVHFLDYGNSETIARDALKKLEPRFHEPCCLALLVGLGLEPLRDDALDKLREWIGESEVQVTLSFGADGWLASLHLDGVDLGLKLINEKLAAPQRADASAEGGEPVSEPPPPPPGCTSMYISHIDTPGLFWLQPADKVDDIEEIQAELQRDADSYGELEARELGAMCAARYSHDELWYRAEILDIDADIVTVRFVDYGNTDVLDNKPGAVRLLPDRLRQIERHAVKTSVNAVPTGTGEWSELATERFTQLAGDLAAPVDVLVVLKDVVTYVDVFVSGVNLTDELVREGHAARADAPAGGGDLPACFASHVNSPSEFWIQLESATPDLQAMEAAMVDAEAFPELEAREEGALCAAKYPEDGQWYRAQVVVHASEGTEVLFMDYGNASIASELRALPDELKAKPALSRKCALQKPRDIKAWSRASELRFNELAAEGATVFQVQFVASGDISIVELYCEGGSVTEQLVGLCEERPAPVGRERSVEGKLCYVRSLDELYLHLVEALPEVDRVTEALAAAEEFEPIAELSVDSVCAAFWAEDEQWYRARLLELAEGGYRVHFFDYGNEAQCSEFRALPDHLAAPRPLAERCRLAAPAAAHDAVRDKLDQFTNDDLTLRIEYLDTSEEPALVNISVDGVDLLAMLVADAPSEPAPAAALAERQENVPSAPEDTPVDGQPEEQKANAERPNENIEETISCIPEKTSTEPSVERLDSDIEKTITEKIEERTEEPFESVLEPPVDTSSEYDEKNADKDNEFDDAEDDLGNEKVSSPRGADLDESADSTDTVIENTSFEGVSDDGAPDEGHEPGTPSTPEKHVSGCRAESPGDASRAPARDESKDSINTDTGYTSGGEHDKCSDKETESPASEHPPETKPELAEIIHSSDNKMHQNNNEEKSPDQVPNKSKAVVADKVLEVESEKEKETSKETVKQSTKEAEKTEVKTEAAVNATE